MKPERLKKLSNVEIYELLIKNNLSQVEYISIEKELRDRGIELSELNIFNTNINSKEEGLSINSKILVLLAPLSLLIYQITINTPPFG